ncbi:hypothetical protein [Streptomyces sp. NPDC050560]|uniref:hypothetical protein n=1 Tax=Streptomyces sp. NPDC050560 TaxID=3365630 RepID=UPI0037897F1C
MPATRRRRPAARLLGPLLLAAACAVQAAGALLPDLRLLAGALAAGYVTDAALHRWGRAVTGALGRVRADATLRQVLRDLLLVAAALVAGEDAGLLAAVLALLAFYALHFGCHAAAILVRRSRTLPVVTRNIDTSALRLSAAPPRLLRRPGDRLLAFGLPATCGLLATAAGAGARWAVAGAALSCVLTGLGLCALLVRLLPWRRPPGEAEVLAWFDEWLGRYRPTAGMYFSGGASSAYQANMWLGPVALLEGRPLIVLRERFMVQRIAATDVPVVCLPKVSHLMRLEHSTLKMLIHPANSGKTSQILRVPTIKHAFVNHGESDKLSSCNPYAKAYDEVWVAGPAARERYALADVGVDDRDVVEIGRPQLDAVRPYEGPPTGSYLTVLYAPTWEGWDGNPGNTSVVLAGENVVRALLADPGVRLLYKPHPMTGSVDPEARAADQRIRALIEEANTRAGHGGRPGARTEAGAELVRRTEELARVTTTRFRRAADDMERMRAQGRGPEPGRTAAVAEAMAAWETAYWASLPSGAHQVVTGARPTLYSCFNHADLLVSDVSSVISDYLSSEKPYAVANTTGLDEDAFREAFPTVRAATVLAPDAGGVPALLDTVRRPERDRLAPERRALKLRLLGPSEPPSAVRFTDAARALCRASDEHRERMADQGARGVPTPRGGAASAAGQARRGR